MSLGPYLHSMWNISASHLISFYWGISPKGNKPEIFIVRADAEVEASILWPPDVKGQLIGKDPDAGKGWRREEKGTTEDGVVGWWLNGHEFEQALGVGEGQRSLACCSMGSQRVRHNLMTEQQSCFAMFCYFLLYNSVNQLYVYICPLPLGPPSRHSIPPLWVITEHRAELPEPFSSFPITI